MLEALAAWVDRVPPVVVYLALGAGAGLENVVPALPFDTFALLGGFLAAISEPLQARWIFLSAWVMNAGTALVTYRLGFTHGRPFFERGWGRRLLNPAQMQRMRGFYDRWGTPAIFFLRFLPGIRTVVPIFAGVSHQPFWRVAVPVASASAIWYGSLIWAGTVAGHNLDLVRGLFDDLTGVLVGVALLLTGALVVWWWRTRHHEH